MKKLLIVDVPDGYEISIRAFKETRMTYESINPNYKEVTLPSDEEIDAMSKQKPINSGHISNRKMGAKFIINKILNQ